MLTLALRVKHGNRTHGEGVAAALAAARGTDLTAPLCNPKSHSRRTASFEVFCWDRGVVAAEYCPLASPATMLDGYQRAPAERQPRSNDQGYVIMSLVLPTPRPSPHLFSRVVNRSTSDRHRSVTPSRMRWPLPSMPIRPGRVPRCILTLPPTRDLRSSTFTINLRQSPNYHLPNTITRKRQKTRDGLVHFLGHKEKNAVARPRGETRGNFRAVVITQAHSCKDALKESPMTSAYKLTDDEFEAVFSRFLNHVFQICVTTDNASTRDVYLQLRRASLVNGEEGIQRELHFIYNNSLALSQLSKLDVQNQRRIADLRRPLEWYPRARGLQRKIFMHVGPTNSGKTYQALKRLEEAQNGAYAGPLRLLAHEVYTRLNAKGQPCVLVTGEERRPPDNGQVITSKNAKIACTVEMMPTCELEVAVIDEIQMIGNAERGWAWTEALLGCRAKEIHLCGEERTVPLIKELAALMGDQIEVKHYTRLSPLAMAPNSLNGDLSKLEKGDCVVSFSIMGIHALRKQIQQRTGKKVAIVYGSLPPETRASQARLFNDPDNDYDYLVASDAVGMGLNL